MHSAQASHITTFEKKAVPKIQNSEPPHVKAVIFFNLGFSYTLPKAICDSYACKKIKFTSPENYRLASRGDLNPFRSLKLNVIKKKGNCFLSIY
jgi:hypothetical protein